LKTLAKQAQARRRIPRLDIITGTTLPFLNHPFTLKVITDEKRSRARATHTDDTITIATPHIDQAKPALIRWYRQQAKLHFTDTAAKLATTINIKPPAIRITGATTRWGSCSKHQHQLMFNWHLMLAPEAIGHYVTAHEIAHLIHSNHSKAFWSKVQELVPGFEIHKQWLKENGHTLTL